MAFLSLSLQNFAGKLTFVHPVSKAVRHGTAILLSERIAITPAHNIYDREGKAFYNNFQFEIEGGQVYCIARYCPMQNYVCKASEKQSKLYDYAVLQLDRSVTAMKPFCSSLLEMDDKYQELTMVLEGRDKRARECEQEVESMREQLDYLHLQNVNLRHQLAILSEQIRSLLTNNKAFQDQILYLRDRVETLSRPKHDLDFSINQNMINMDNHCTEIAQVDESMIPNKEGKLVWNLHDFLLQKCYLLEQGEGRVRCRQTNFKQQRILAAQPLPQKSRLIFTMINYSDHNSSFSFGIVSGRKGEKSYCCVEFDLSIGSACGSILLNGEAKLRKESAFYMRKGETVTMEVHLDELLVEFKNEKMAKTVQLKPSHEPFFPFLMLWNKGDEASLLPS